MIARDGDIPKVRRATSSASRQKGRELIDGDSRSETAPPGIDAADDLVGGPDEKSTLDDNRKGHADWTRRGPDPEQNGRHDHDPQHEVGPLRDRDGACFAIAENQFRILRTILVGG